MIEKGEYTSHPFFRPNAILLKVSWCWDMGACTYNIIKFCPILDPHDMDHDI